MEDFKYDGNLDLATGRSRNETSWKNKAWTWRQLVEKLSQEHRTAETVTEYHKSEKQRQTEIKDIGGFVGGYINGGRRKPENIMFRQVLTLDMDFAISEAWDVFTLCFMEAGVIYSTHSHTAEKPRFRLIMPLSRPVNPHEYVAIGRRIGGLLGIELFDNTGFQPERLMYWPSTPKDGEYVFEYQDGEWLDADEILATYHNWRDASEWPVSEKHNEAIGRAITKQVDPTEKPGLIGAFCRTYDIDAAIETFLSDKYEPCAADNRYTFVGGSTAAGLITYEGKYTYSHHGTDPTSGMLCNAYDLVRIHKFGIRDEDSAASTASHRLPSYLAMTDFCMTLPDVRGLVVSERSASAREDFAGIDLDDVEEDSEEWKRDLDIDKKGNVHSTINNVVLILKNDPFLRNRIALNTFEQREVALKDLPWRKVVKAPDYLTDVDDAGLRHYMEKMYGISAGSKVQDGLSLNMINNSFHPIRDYLDPLVWDGKERVDTLFIDYLGAEDLPYTREVTRKALTAAVARIYVPGIKFDHMLTLIGEQGIGKSTILDKIGGSWFTDSFGTIQGKEAFEQIQGVWIIEVAELSGLRKAEADAVKHFIAKREDRYRVAYGKRVENFPRQCVFFGTTNRRDFLTDTTGNRRFWPVETNRANITKSVWADLTDNEIRQVWAEACAIFHSGEQLKLSTEVEAYAVAVQGDHLEKDDRIGSIEKYLDTLVPNDWDERDTFERRSWLNETELKIPGVRLRGQICVAEIWAECLGGQLRDMNRNSTKFIHDIMRILPGWHEAKSNRNFMLYGKQRAYYRKIINELSGNTNF